MFEFSNILQCTIFWFQGHIPPVRPWWVPGTPARRGRYASNLKEYPRDSGVGCNPRESDSPVHKPLGYICHGGSLRRRVHRDRGYRDDLQHYMVCHLLGIWSTGTDIRFRKVSHNATRGGIRLIGPSPRWARESGGEGGAHPSNLIEYGYPTGTLNWTGDE